MAPLPAPNDLAVDVVDTNDTTLPLRFDPPPAGPCQVIPFPVTRRAAFIAKAIATGARYQPEGEAGYLNGVLSRHAIRLERIGVAPELARADTDSLAAALGMMRAS